jgi:hypothetical protein
LATVEGEVDGSGRGASDELPGERSVGSAIEGAVVLTSMSLGPIQKSPVRQSPKYRLPASVTTSGTVLSVGDAASVS